MKVVALVSGDKDSCFNILHCLANGHRVIALANLKPADSHVQELDSFMFQTVGHDALDYYSDCCNLPMYRGLITGSSSNQELEYQRTKDDEIEDLYKLLNKVKSNHPDVEAVSVGAILSSYQRTRVEDVCRRLGLTSLAFLWQRNQMELMQEMVDSSMHAILIKVAAIGLNKTHLAKTLKEIFPTMINLDRKFGVHICGEGGEFESLVLDCPFFVKRLEIVESEIIESGNDVSYLKPTKFKVVEKSIEMDDEFHCINSTDVDWAKFVPKRPTILTEPFQQIHDKLRSLTDKIPKPFESTPTNFINSPMKTIKLIKNKLFVSNITSTKASVEDQVKDVFHQLNEILTNYNINPSHIQHSTLLLSSMSNFQEINTHYMKFFTEPLPPSRVCIETTLPSESLLQLSIVALVDRSGKKGVHIQGRSYWAPANIGPYSQTIMDEDLVASISGQIPLIPSTMELCPEQDGLYDVVLSLQHFNSVKEITGAVNQLSTVAFIKNEGYLQNIVESWREYCGLDLSGDNYLESLIIVKVNELPKGANVEWGGLAYKRIEDLYGDDSDEEEISKNLQDSLNLELDKYSIKANNGPNVTTLSSSFEEFKHLPMSPDHHYTIYTKPENIIGFNSSISIDYVPVSSIWNYKGDMKEFGIVIR